jgi:DNA repair exonuclease SbcCD ATPase subunit
MKSPFARTVKALGPAPENKGARQALEDVQAEIRDLGVRYGEALSRAERLAGERDRLLQALDGARRSEEAVAGVQRQLADLEPKIAAAGQDLQAIHEAVQAAGPAVTDDLLAARRRAESELQGLRALSSGLVERASALGAGGGNVPRAEAALLQARVAAEEARAEADGFGAELKAARQRVAGLEAAAAAESAERVAELEAEDRRLAAEITALSGAAVEEAHELARRLWEVRAKVAPLISRRDDILREASGLRGEKEPWWKSDDRRGFVFLGTPGNGSGDHDLSEILGAVGVDVRQFTRRRTGN